MPVSPLWLYEERHLEAGAAGAAAQEPATLPRCSEAVKRKTDQVIGAQEVDRLNDYYGTDYSCCIKEKLTQALRYLKTSANQGLLVQVWAPVKSGDRCVLTTSGQPFVYFEQSNGLYEYRAVSVGYKFSVDGEEDGDLGLPGRVYKQKVLEWTPNVQFYSIKEFRRLNHAISLNVHGTVALPVLDPSSLACVAVVELIMTAKKMNYTNEIDIVCKALKAVNLKSTEILDHPNAQICNEGRQLALAEILKVITIVCEEYKLPLAQTWVPCKHQNVLAYGGGLRKTCSSIDGGCTGGICFSASDVAFHIIDASVWKFRDACVEHHLQKGQGVVGKAYLSGRPCFSSDVLKFSKSEYPLVHYARMLGLACCLAICMRSAHTGTDDYIIEFFLPREIKNEGDQRILLASMLTLMNSCTQSLQAAGDLGLNNVSPKDINNIMNEINRISDSPDRLYTSDGRNVPYKQQGHDEDTCGLVDKCAHSRIDLGVEINGLPNYNSSCGDKRSKPVVRKRRKAEKVISLEVLQQYFSGSLKSAAKSLGVCPTTMKRICRQHGITRWPSRKINKVNRSLTKLKEVMESAEESEKKFAFASITGPLALPIRTSDSPKFRKQHDDVLAGPSISASYGEKIPSTRYSVDFGCHHSTHESAHALVEPPNSILKGHCDAHCSQSSSGERCSDSHASEGSCQALRANELSVCRPIEPAFLVQQLCHNPNGLVEPAYDLQQPPNCVQIKDSGSSKDLKLLFGSAVEIFPDAHTVDPVEKAKNLQHASTVTIKACYKEDIIRFRFQCDLIFSILKDEIAGRLGIDVGTFDVKFLDDDNEWVKLSCDADLNECIELSKISSRQVVRLLVTDFTAILASSYGSSG